MNFAWAVMAEPGHPFLASVIEALPRWNWRFGSNYPTVMFSTGPGFLDFQLRAYLARQRDRGERMPEAERVSIMHRDLYSHRMSSYFQHHHGSSWHQWDAALFWAMGFWTRA